MEAFVYVYIGIILVFKHTYLDLDVNYMFIVFTFVLIVLTRFVINYGLAGICKLIGARKYIMLWSEVSLVFISGIDRGIISYILIHRMPASYPKSWHKDSDGEIINR